MKAAVLHEAEGGGNVGSTPFCVDGIGAGPNNSIGQGGTGKVTAGRVAHGSQDWRSAVADRKAKVDPLRDTGQAAGLNIPWRPAQVDGFIAWAQLEFGALLAQEDVAPGCESLWKDLVVHTDGRNAGSKAAQGHKAGHGARRNSQKP
eukprot:gene5150-biopygen4588